MKKIINKLWKWIRIIAFIVLTVWNAEFAGIFSLRNSSRWKGVWEFILEFVFGEDHMRILEFPNLFIWHPSIMAWIRFGLYTFLMFIAMVLLTVVIKNIKSIGSGLKSMFIEILDVCRKAKAFLSRLPSWLWCIYKGVFPAHNQNRNVMIWIKEENDITYYYGSARSEKKKAVLRLSINSLVSENGKSKKLVLKHRPRIIFGANGSVYLVTSGKNIQDENGCKNNKLHVYNKPRTITLSGYRLTICTEGEM